jgi:hypothetical protein
MPDISVENAIRSVLTRIDAAWREKKFDGLEECFDDDAVIVGPNYAEYAVGGKACAESYREFARVAGYGCVYICLANDVCKGKWL